MVFAYDDERRTWLQGRSADRTAQVTTVLAGDALEVSQGGERLLSYELGQTHLGLVAWCDPGHEVDLEREARRLAVALGAHRDPLVVAPDAATVWAWLPLPSRSAARALMSPVTGVRLAIGDPGSGVDGFRTTHRQALAARAVALGAAENTRAAVTTYAEAGLVSLLRADVADLAAWVQGVLGGLATDDDAHERLRETARALLAHQGSHTAAAAELSVHRNTVLYRVRRAEEARGRPFSDGRLDVEVALLACRLLGRRVLC